MADSLQAFVRQGAQIILHDLVASPDQEAMVTWLTNYIIDSSAKITRLRDIGRTGEADEAQARMMAVLFDLRGAMNETGTAIPPSNNDDGDEEQDQYTTTIVDEASSPFIPLEELYPPEVLKGADEVMEKFGPSGIGAFLEPVIRKVIEEQGEEVLTQPSFYEHEQQQLKIMARRDLQDNLQQDLRGVGSVADGFSGRLREVLKASTRGSSGGEEEQGEGTSVNFQAFVSILTFAVSVGTSLGFSGPDLYYSAKGTWDEWRDPTTALEQMTPERFAGMTESARNSWLDMMRRRHGDAKYLLHFNRLVQQNFSLRTHTTRMAFHTEVQYWDQRHLIPDNTERAHLEKTWVVPIVDQKTGEVLKASTLYNPVTNDLQDPLANFRKIDEKAGEEMSKVVSEVFREHQQELLGSLGRDRKTHHYVIPVPYAYNQTGGALNEYGPLDTVINDQAGGQFVGWTNGVGILPMSRVGPSLVVTALKSKVLQDEAGARAQGPIIESLEKMGTGNPYLVRKMLRPLEVMDEMVTLLHDKALKLVPLKRISVMPNMHRFLKLHARLENMRRIKDAVVPVAKSAYDPRNWLPGWLGGHASASGLEKVNAPFFSSTAVERATSFIFGDRDLGPLKALRGNVPLDHLTAENTVMSTIIRNLEEKGDDQVMKEFRLFVTGFSEDWAHGNRTLEILDGKVFNLLSDGFWTTDTFNAVTEILDLLETDLRQSAVNLCSQAVKEALLTEKTEGITAHVAEFCAPIINAEINHLLCETTARGNTRFMEGFGFSQFCEATGRALAEGVYQSLSPERNFVFSFGDEAFWPRLSEYLRQHIPDEAARNVTLTALRASANGTSSALEAINLLYSGWDQTLQVNTTAGDFFRAFLDPGHEEAGARLGVGQQTIIVNGTATATTTTGALQYLGYFGLLRGENVEQQIDIATMVHSAGTQVATSAVLTGIEIFRCWRQLKREVRGKMTETQWELWLRTAGARDTPGGKHLYWATNGHLAARNMVLAWHTLLDTKWIKFKGYPVFPRLTMDFARHAWAVSGYTIYHMGKNLFCSVMLSTAASFMPPEVMTWAAPVAMTADVGKRLVEYLKTAKDSPERAAARGRLVESVVVPAIGTAAAAAVYAAGLGLDQLVYLLTGMDPGFGVTLSSFAWDQGVNIILAFYLKSWFDRWWDQGKPGYELLFTSIGQKRVYATLQAEILASVGTDTGTTGMRDLIDGLLVHMVDFCFMPILLDEGYRRVLQGLEYRGPVGEPFGLRQLVRHSRDRHLYDLLFNDLTSRGRDRIAFTVSLKRYLDLVKHADDTSDLGVLIPHLLMPDRGDVHIPSAAPFHRHLVQTNLPYADLLDLLNRPNGNGLLDKVVTGLHKFLLESFIQRCGVFRIIDQHRISLLPSSKVDAQAALFGFYSAQDIDAMKAATQADETQAAKNYEEAKQKIERGRGDSNKQHQIGQLQDRNKERNERVSSLEYDTKVSYTGPLPGQDLVAKGVHIRAMITGLRTGLEKLANVRLGIRSVLNRDGTSSGFVSEEDFSQLLFILGVCEKLLALVLSMAGNPNRQPTGEKLRVQLACAHRNARLLMTKGSDGKFHPERTETIERAALTREHALRVLAFDSEFGGDKLRKLRFERYLIPTRPKPQDYVGAFELTANEKPKDSVKEWNLARHQRTVWCHQLATMLTHRELVAAACTANGAYHSDLRELQAYCIILCFWELEGEPAGSPFATQRASEGVFKKLLAHDELIGRTSFGGVGTAADPAAVMGDEKEEDEEKKRKNARDAEVARATALAALNPFRQDPLRDWLMNEVDPYLMRPLLDESLHAMVSAELENRITGDKNLREVTQNLLTRFSELGVEMVFPENKPPRWVFRE